MKRWVRDERGAAALEFAVTLPVLLLLLATMVGAGRLWSTKSALLQVAREAGRAAVEAPDSASAGEVAQRVAEEQASACGLDASRLTVEHQVGLEPGGLYTVVTRYDVDLGDLPGLGFIPGSVGLEARHVEPVDLHRAT